MNQFAIDRRNGVLLVTFAGSVTPESLGAFDSEVKDFVAREGSMPTIIDFTGVVSVEILSSAVANRGEQHPVMDRMPRVFVTPDPHLFGLLRLYSAHQDISGERPPAVVRSLAEAFRELSLIQPDFVPIAIEPRRHDAADASEAKHA